jgi:molybdate transport system substrate-binding protein
MKAVASRRPFVVAAAAAALSFWASASNPAWAQSPDLVVFAAASLKNALDDINALRQRDTGKKAAISYAASPALARQIEQAAPADIFISADLDWMDYLQQRSLIKTESRGNLLANRIVLIAAKDSPIAARIAPGFDLAGLLGPGNRLAMADTKAVPAGKYGKAALEALKVWPSVEAKIAQAENVRAALLLVSRGETPLGIVYRTDATADPGVKIVDMFPAELHPPIVYPVALTAGRAHPDAVAFLDYLKSAKAKPLFEKQGFAVLD